MLEIKYKEDIEVSQERFEGLIHDNALINISQVYESLRYNDYSVENGLGEIVDNSVEAGASEIRAYFTKKIKRFGKKEIEEFDKIIILDNGFLNYVRGMIDGS